MSSAPKELRPDQVASANPVFKELDEKLLTIFKSYRAQLKAILIMVAVGILAFVSFAGIILTFGIIFAGFIMYWYNVVHIVQHFGLVRRYKAVLADAGVESTPVFARASSARPKAVIGLVIATFPGLLGIAYVSQILAR